MSDTTDFLSTREVLELLDGVTYRQLDYWVRQGYVEPDVPADGPGSRRSFSHELAGELARRVDSLHLLADRAHLHRRVLAGEVILTEAAKP